MKKVKYKGPTVDLGRFGYIENGQKLKMTEHEWSCLVNDKRFKLLTKPHSKEELAIFAKIKPLACPAYDLRSIPWEKDNLFNILIARSSKSKLLKVLESMYFLGGDAVPQHNIHDDRMWLVDHIIEGATKMGWLKLTRSERLALPDHKDVVAEPEEPVKADAIAWADKLKAEMDGKRKETRERIAACRTEEELVALQAQLETERAVPDEKPSAKPKGRTRKRRRKARVAA